MGDARRGPRAGMAAPGARWDAVAGVGMGMGAGALGTMPWAAIAPARTSPDFGHFGHPDGPALWGYARSAPGMMVDPRGEWWFGTAIAGGVINMAVQTANNMRKGQDFRTAVQNIDYRSVLVSASLGFVAPGWAGLAYNRSQPGYGALFGYQTFIGLTAGFTNKAISMGPNEPWRYDLLGALECFAERWRLRNSLIWAGIG